MARKNELFRTAITAASTLGIAFALTACAGLLPDAKQNTTTPWRTYGEAQAMFDKIVPGQTSLTDLKALGVDPAKTANVAYLGHADLLRRLLPSASFDVRYLDPGLQECITPKNTCFAYQIEQVSLDRKRDGNFWLDFFNFKRHVSVSGFAFDAVVVVKGDLVVYKLWSGKPNVEQMEVETSPLGPLQSIGSGLIR